MDEILQSDLFDIVRDENGKLSSTRLVIFFAGAVFLIATLSQLFIGANIDPDMYKVTGHVVMLAVGANAARSSVKTYARKDKEDDGH